MEGSLSWADRRNDRRTEGGTGQRDDLGRHKASLREPMLDFGEAVVAPTGREQQIKRKDRAGRRRRHRVVHHMVLYYDQAARVKRAIAGMHQAQVVAFVLAM